MSVLFDVAPSRLSLLGPEESVCLIRDLVWADASISDLKKNHIDIPSAVDAADGGVDGIVMDATHSSKHDIIKKGVTCYQIKSGSFSPSSNSNIDDILFNKTTKKLKDRIRTCLDAGGTLVIALTGWDIPDRTEGGTKKKFLTRLGKVDTKYTNAKIEIWRQNTIIRFLRSFPSLRLKIHDVCNGPFFFHDMWSKMDDMKPTLHLDKEHEQYLENLRDALRCDVQPRPICITGDPGMGKTRFALEATKTEDLAPLTIYVDDPSQLTDLSFLRQVIGDDAGQFAILVVDECDYNSSTHIWNKIKNYSNRIKLVAIINEREPDKDVIDFELPELGDEQISKILADYKVPEEPRSKWVRYCAPYPRAAHVIGKNLSENPDDIFRTLDTVNVWDRFIAGRTALDSDEFHKRKTVLLWISLFKRFGFEPPYDTEARFISNKINENHDVPYADFVDIIGVLRKRKILQGHTTLYITPKIFHVKLWMEWWETYGSTMMFKLEDIPSVDHGVSDIRTDELHGMRKWYCDMFKYACTSPVAAKTARELLGRGGILEHDDHLLSELGAGFALGLAAADPHAALSFLNHFIGPKSRSDLVGFKRGRREAVRALELTSMKKDLFEDSARLLLALGDAENENFSNNASGTFKNLFSTSSARLSAIETSPLQRLSIIREALCSNSKRQRTLAIDACDAALKTEFSTRLVPVHDVFEHVRLDPWKPKSRNEVIDYYKSILNILANPAEDHTQDETDKMISVILNNVENLVSIAELVDCMVSILWDLHERNNAYDELIIEKTTRVLVFRDIYLTPVTVSSLKKLQNKITGNDYHSLLRRHVGMYLQTDWATGTKDVKRDDGSGDNPKLIESLAMQSLDDGVLCPELEWLVTTRAKNGHRFGRALGTCDKKLKTLPEILEAQRSAASDSSVSFLAGYFSALFERNVDEWETQLDLMAKDENLYRCVPKVTLMSGMTDRSGIRIVTLMRQHTDLGPCTLSSFAYGMVVKHLSESVFVAWVDLLADYGTSETAAVLVDLFYSYFVHGCSKPLPRKLTLEILSDKDMIKEISIRATTDTMLDFRYKEIGLRFLQQYPEDSLLVAQGILENIAPNSIFDVGCQSRQILDRAAILKPRDVCGALLAYVGPPIDSRAFAIRLWLRDLLFSEAKTAKVMTAVLFEWVDKDPEMRAAYCADLLPAKFEIVRGLLTRYGDREDVQIHLASCFNTESFNGSASGHYRSKRDEFASLRQREKDPKARRWLDLYISEIEHRIKQWTTYEERLDF